MILTLQLWLTSSFLYAMFSLIDTYWSDLLTTFFNPQKRVFIGYLVCALGIAIIYWVFIKRSSVRQSLSALFSPKVWLSLSSIADGKILLINKLLMLWLSPLLISQLVLATAVFYWFYEILPSRPQLLMGWSTISVSVVFTLCYFILDDFARFYVHRLMHRWPLLWAFHKVHHSAQRLTPLTVFRTHPVESIIFSLRSIVVQALSIGIFVFFLGDKADLVTVLGANIFTFMFNIVGSNLRHSHIPVGYWKPLEKIVISPAQHQIHHSLDEKHWDKNYGVALACWDWLWGSHYHSEKNQRLVFGLKQQKQHSLHALYILPFKESGSIIKNCILSTHNKLKSISYYYKVIMLWKY